MPFLRGRSASILACTGSLEDLYLIIKLALGIESSGSMGKAHSHQHSIQNSGICATQEPPYHHSPAAGHPRRYRVRAGSCAHEPFVAQDSCSNRHACMLTYMNMDLNTSIMPLYITYYTFLFVIYVHILHIGKETLKAQLI